MWVELGGQGQVDFSGAFTAPHTKYGHKASHPSGQEGGSRGTDRCLKSRSARTGPHVAPRGLSPRPWALLQKPRAPPGQRLWAQRGCSLRACCVSLWGGQAQDHMKAATKAPARKTGGDTGEETKAGEAGAPPRPRPCVQLERGPLPASLSILRGRLPAGLGP